MVTDRLITHTVFDISLFLFRLLSRLVVVPFEKPVNALKMDEEDEAFRQLPALCRRASSSIGFFISLGKRYSEKAIDRGEARSIEKKVLTYLLAALCRTADR